MLKWRKTVELASLANPKYHIQLHAWRGRNEVDSKDRVQQSNVFYQTLRVTIIEGSRNEIGTI